jgi:hypothetical protein
MILVMGLRMHVPASWVLFLYEAKSRMTDNAEAQEKLTKLLNGWDAHAEFAGGAEFARKAFQHVTGDEKISPTIGRHQAVNHAHLRKVYLEAREKYPEFADTLAWLLWWKIADFDRLELLTKAEAAVETD